MVESIAETNVMLAETSGKAAEIVRMPAAMALERRSVRIFVCEATHLHVVR